MRPGGFSESYLLGDDGPNLYACVDRLRDFTLTRTNGVAARALAALLSSPACRAELLEALTENIASPVCSMSYCWGATGANDPQYPLCDGCNQDGTISTLVTVAVDAALLVARTPEGDER